MKQHKVLEKHHRVCQRANKACMSDLNKKLLNGLDKIKEDICIASKKHCRKLTMGEVDFSPQVAHLQQTKDTWQKIVRQLRGKRVSSMLIKRKAKQCGILRPLSQSLAEATREMQMAKKKWEEAKSQAPVLCQEFLKVVAKKMSKREKKDKETVHRRSMQNDNQVKAHQLLKHMLKKQLGKLVNKVQVESATGTVEH